MDVAGAVSQPLERSRARRGLAIEKSQVAQQSAMERCGKKLHKRILI